MPKVTVYVTEDHLKMLRDSGVKNVSGSFQAFVESLAGNSSASKLYTYVRELMPVTHALERLRRRIAREVEEGGPPARGGPIMTALTILIYKEIASSQEELGRRLEQEFTRFGLNEFVGRKVQEEDLSNLEAHEIDDNELDEWIEEFGDSTLETDRRGFSPLLEALETMLRERAQASGGRARRNERRSSRKSRSSKSED